MSLLIFFGVIYGWQFIWVFLIAVSGGHCPERKVKYFLWSLPYRPDCEVEPIKVWPWGAFNWCNYQVTWKCVHCGARSHDFGLSEVHAMRLKKRIKGGE